jgi:cyclic beta-1,2-glucan synthetase
MYRLIVESLLGLRRQANELRFAPCLPADWPGFRIHYRYQETLYDITVSQMPAIDPGRSGVTSITVDGVEQAERVITLVDDRREHLVTVSVYVQ